MGFIQKTLAAALLLLGFTPAWSQLAGTVQGLQMPAWVERQSATAPLAPGMLIQSGDRLKTGSGARILLQLEEGSFVKLGEDADFTVRDISPAASSGGVFGGLLDVVKGAFRFTTTLLSKQRRRNLSIRISAVTAGVRGTDLWGKATTDKDILVLIDGDISVQREGEEAFRMNQPLSLYIVPRGGVAKPVAPVDPEQLKRWASEVELTINDGALSGSGRWNLILMSLVDRSLAVQNQLQLQKAGYPAVLNEVTLKGRRWVRVVIPGFARFEGARKVGARLNNKFGIRDPWVSHI